MATAWVGVRNASWSTLGIFIISIVSVTRKKPDEQIYIGPTGKYKTEKAGGVIIKHDKRKKKKMIRRRRRTFACLLIFMALLLLVYHTQLASKLKQRSVYANERNSTESQKQDATQEETATAKPTLILYWSTVFGNKVYFTPENRRFRPSRFFSTLEKGDCPVPCEVSTNHSRVNESSAFIVHARDTHMIPPSTAVPWILHTNENPVYTPVLRNASFMSKFKFLISYRLDSDFPSPVFPPPDLTPPIPFKEKNNSILAAFSNCERVRTEYMKQLMKYMRVDSYGSCLQNKKGLTKIYGKSFKEEKMKILRGYKFALVFMNQDCDYFVDDRMIHALSSGAVPVYMGTDKIDEFLPGNLNKSIIKVRDFKRPKDLADYLKYLSNNETAYNQYLEWKTKGLGDIEDTVIGRFWNPKYPTICQICIELSKRKVRKDGLKPDDCKARRPQDWGI